MEGRVLVVDQSPADRKLLTYHLASTALVLKMVESSGAAIDAVRKHDYDLILCDLHLESDAVRMIKQIRAAEYKGPIIVVTAETSAGRLADARAAGANEIIGKPHSAAYLASLLAEWLEVPDVDRPLYSHLEEVSGMAELIADFVDDVQRKTHALEKAMSRSDLGAARGTCVELFGSGNGFGFPAVTEAARDALAAIDTVHAKEVAAAAPVKRLIAICQRLRCGSSVRPMGNWQRSA